LIGDDEISTRKVRRQCWGRADYGGVNLLRARRGLRSSKQKQWTQCSLTSNAWMSGIILRIFAGDAHGGLRPDYAPSRESRRPTLPRLWRFQLRGPGHGHSSGHSAHNAFGAFQTDGCRRTTVRESSYMNRQPGCCLVGDCRCRFPVPRFLSVRALAGDPTMAGGLTQHFATDPCTSRSVAIARLRADYLCRARPRTPSGRGGGTALVCDEAKAAARHGHMVEASVPAVTAGRTRNAFALTSWLPPPLVRTAAERESAVPQPRG